MKNYYLLFILLLLTGCQWNLDKILFDKPCVKPSATISAPTGTLLVNANLTFALLNKTGDIGTVTWDFGDASATKTGETVTYAYPKSGTYTVKITITNRCNDTFTATQSVTVDTKDAPVFTIAATTVAADSARVTLTFSSVGKNTPISEFGLCYSTTNNPPTIADNPTKYNATGATAGTGYTGTLKGLTAGAVYYVRGYCKTDAADPIYSPVVSFTTGVNQPVINTLAVSAIEVDRAKINVQFTSKGSAVVTITEFGFCYSDTQNPPTIANSPTKMTGSGDPAQIYSQTLGGLTGGKTYYVRAYVKTDRSPDPIYGPVQTFTTQPEPVVTTLDVTGLSSVSGVMGARVSNVTQFTPGAIGVCFSRTNNPPTIADETARTTTNFQADNFFNVTLGATYTYSYRAFVLLPSGGVRYGTPIKQLTVPAVVAAQAPTVQTVDAVDVNYTKANLVMQITAAPTQLANYGIVYSKTNATPTLTNGTQMVNKVAAYTINALYAFITDTDYSQTLTANTTYYYRGYATTIAVNGKQETAYGDVKTFYTIPPPTIVSVAGGTFTMGSDLKDATKPLGIKDGDESPAHKVTLSDFSIGAYEVTVKQYRDFTTATSRAAPAATPYTAQDSYPITNITYDDAVAYCNWLSSITGKKYRLPTEAEWEYAARGGAKSVGNPYSGSTDANTAGWNKSNTTTSPVSPQAVGLKAKNELGAYDMSGNAWEIVSDLYAFTYYQISGNTTNPTGPTSAQQGADAGLRTKRGGSFSAEPLTTSVIERGQIFPSKPASADVGFRVVLQP